LHIFDERHKYDIQKHFISCVWNGVALVHLLSQIGHPDRRRLAGDSAIRPPQGVLVKGVDDGFLQCRDEDADEPLEKDGRKEGRNERRNGEKIYVYTLYMYVYIYVYVYIYIYSA
jgi:hypothetical protein